MESNPWIISGSTCEGAAICHWFRDDAVNPELDVMLCCGIISDETATHNLAECTENTSTHKMAAPTK